MKKTLNATAMTLALVALGLAPHVSAFDSSGACDFDLVVSEEVVDLGFTGLNVPQRLVNSALASTEGSGDVPPIVKCELPDTDVGGPAIVILFLANPFYAPDEVGCAAGVDATPIVSDGEQGECLDAGGARTTGGPGCPPQEENWNCRYGRTGNPRGYEFRWSSGATLRCMMKTAPGTEAGRYMWEVNVEKGHAETPRAQWARASDLSVTKNTSNRGGGPSGACEGYVHW